MLGESNSIKGAIEKFKTILIKHSESYDFEKKSNSKKKNSNKKKQSIPPQHSTATFNHLSDCPPAFGPLNCPPAFGPLNCPQSSAFLES